MALDRTVKWSAALASQGDVLTTQLNALADGAWSALGAEFTNDTGLWIMGKLVLSVTFGTAPAATGSVVFYLVEAPDGTNYDTLDSDNDPRAEKQIAVVSVIDTTSAQKRATPGMFIIPPAKVKLSAKNQAGQAFPASGSTVTLYTWASGLHT